MAKLLFLQLQLVGTVWTGAALVLLTDPVPAVALLLVVSLSTLVEVTEGLGVVSGAANT